MKRIGIVILGLVASALIGSLLLFITIKATPHISGDDSYVWIPALITVPIGFFFGSIVTGYFSYYALEHKRNLVWMPPGLYCAGLMLIQFRYGGGSVSDNIKGSLLFILMCLLWYLPSLAGVALGYFLRFKIICWWYGFDEKGQVVRPYKADDEA